MTQDQKKAALASYLVTKGIIDPADVEKEISRMAGTLASSQAAEKGLTTDIDKAYEVMSIEQGASTPTKSTGVAVQPTEAVSAAEALQIRKTLLQEKDSRTAVSANSTIEQYIFDRPAPAEWIPANAKGVIPKESWDKIVAKYGNRVLADDPEGTKDGIASTTNFNALKAAAESGSEVDVYIGGLNTKPVGYVLSVGSATGSGNTRKNFDREGMLNFLTLETAGYILASDTKPGIRLRCIAAKNDPRNPGKVTEPKTVLTDANKKKAVEAGAYVISKEASSETKEFNLKSALAFKVETDQKKANGEGNVVRTVRVPVKLTLPALVRKKEFADMFRAKDDTKSNSNLEFAPAVGSKMAKNITEAQSLAIAQLRAKLNDPESIEQVAGYADRLKAFDAPAGSVPANVAM